MNKRETFYFTNEERAICQGLGLSRKALKKALSAFIYKALIDEKKATESVEKLIKIAKTNWIFGEDED